MMPDFAPPGPGAFVLDATHYPHAPPRMHAKAVVANLPRGIADGMRRVATFVERNDFFEVNGFLYSQLRFVGVPSGEAAQPRAASLLARAHPEYIDRAHDAATVFDRKPWREDLHAWDNEVKPRNEKRYLELLRTDVDAADNDALAMHVIACHAELERALYLHGRYMISSILPSADFAAHVADWVGAPPIEALREVSGASDASRGMTPDLESLLTALRKAPARDGDSLLSGTDAKVVLESLRARSDEIGAAAREHLGRAGYRLTSGYDAGQPYAWEVPNLLLDTIRKHLDTARRTPPGTSIRDRVPDKHRSEFDSLFEEARVMTRLRDERGLYGVLWISGILRRALLATGARLLREHKLADATDALEASSIELVALLTGESPHAASVFSERAATRAALNQKGAPRLLGKPPPPIPPPTEMLPPSMHRGQRAEAVLLGGLFFENQTPPDGTDSIKGLGISAGTYEGTACVVRSPADLHRVKAGDILVAEITSGAYAAVLGMLGAVVTDRGGALSHAAIIAREHGIPGVVGTRDGTRRITDGARIRVDGSAGEVKLLR